MSSWASRDRSVQHASVDEEGKRVPDVGWRVHEGVDTSVRDNAAGRGPLGPLLYKLGRIGCA